MKKLFNHSCKKNVAGILAAAMMAGTIFASSASVQAAAQDKALSMPIDFIGVTEHFGNAWQSSSRFHVNGSAHIAPFTTGYTYSYTCYIPKTVFANGGSTVVLDSWFELQTPAQEEGQDDTWLGNLRPKYQISLIKEKGQVQFGVWDTENNYQLVEDSNVYAGFLSLGTAGDFYKVVIKDAPILNVLYGENDAESTIDTSINGSLNMNISLTGLNNQITSIAYLDDISLKSGSGTLIETDASEESLKEIAYYDYVIAENDATCVERPASINLNTSLLKLKKSSGKVKVGKTISINATAAASGSIKYTSSDKKVATVNSKGKVKGITAGTAKITVSANGVSKTYTVKVEN